MIAPSHQKGDCKPANASQRARLGMWCAIVAVFVVLLAVLIIVHIASSKTGETETKPKRNKISSQTPVSQERKVKSTAKDAAQEKDSLPPQRPHEVRDGMLMLSNGTLLPTNKLRKVSLEERKSRFKYAIFEHSTDNELAAILTLKPGQALIGGPIRHADYKADFLKSLETPVVVSKDDPADVQDVKRAVIESRKLLKEAIDAGEDPTYIIRSAYEEAQKLALYKDDIRREVLKMAKEGDYSEEEIDDLVAAANKMLESKGIEPMRLGPIMKARLRTLKQ